MDQNKDRVAVSSEDEHELDDLFLTDEMTVSKAIKQAKRRSTVRTFIIGLLASLVVIGGIQSFGQWITNKQQSAVENAVAESYDIYYPDTFIGETRRFKGTWSGSVVYSTYKLVSGHVVYAGDHEVRYGLFGDNLQGIESQSILGDTYTMSEAMTPKYNLFGQRQMVFYYPFLKYVHYRNDFPVLSQIEPGKKVEMALSFDKGYSVADVRKMLAHQQITWYWINTLTPNEMQSMKEKEPSQTPVCSERTAVGIKTIDASGQPLSNPVAQFINAVQRGAEDAKRLPTNTAEAATLKYDLLHVLAALKGTSSSINPSRLTVFGVVVTGDVKSIMSLSRSSFIKAASLGTVVDPY